MSETTTRDLDADQKLCDAATKGPWIFLEEFGVRACYPDAEGVSCAFEHICQEPEYDDRADDMKFVAEAREAMPWYIAEVRKLRESVASERNLINEAGRLIESQKRIIDSRQEEILKLSDRRDELVKALNFDQTGLANGLDKVIEAVKGWGWIQEDNGWGCYEWEDHTEATMRKEFSHCIETVLQIAKTCLRESGDRATKTIRQEPFADAEEERRRAEIDGLNAKIAELETGLRRARVVFTWKRRIELEHYAKIAALEEENRQLTEKLANLVCPTETEGVTP